MVTITESGRCSFRIYMPNAGGIELLGSFNNWTAAKGGAVELAHDHDGWWSASATLGAGEHEFCYLVDGQIWMPDYAAGGIRRNASGRWISLVTIPERSLAELKPVGAVAEQPVGMEAGVQARGDQKSTRSRREPAYAGRLSPAAEDRAGSGTRLTP